MKKIYVIATLIFAALLTGFNADALNVYAYGLSGSLSSDGSTYTVNYSLNDQATALAIVVYNGKTLVATFTPDSLSAGSHSYSFSTASLPKGVNLSWKVKATSENLTSVMDGGKSVLFGAPCGLAVDCNPSSTHFGRLYVAESQSMYVGDTFRHKYYFSNPTTTGIGQGVYVFEPTLDAVKNSSGKAGFRGGLVLDSLISDKNVFDPKRLALSEDGRLFVSRFSSGVSPIYEINTDDLNADFKPIFTGASYDTNYNLVTSSGDYIAGPNLAMTVMGSGANLKIATISVDKNGIASDSAGYRAAEYNLGTATSWSAAPSRFVTAYDQHYTYNYDFTNIQYDPNGGLWYLTNNSSASATKPFCKHVKKDFTTEDFGVTSNYSPIYCPKNCGICLSPDSTKLALVRDSESHINIYNVDYSTSPVTLTKLYDFTGDFDVDALAWDYANNLFCASIVGKEVVEFILPRASGDVTTPAMATYNFNIPVPDVYLIGSIDEASGSTTWDATKGCKMTYDATSQKYSAIVNMTKAGGTFGVSKVIAENNDAGGWTYVNASRFIPDADGLSLDYGVAKPMSAWESGKDYAWSFPILGKFKVVVDLNAMTIRDTLVTSVYPMNLYVIGNTNFSNTWSTSVPLAKMTETADGVYSGAFKLNEVSTDNQYQYFSIVKNLGADWDAVNVTGNRFGPSVDGTVLATDGTVSTDFGKNNTAYKVPYTEGNNLWLTVDLTAGTNGTISALSNTTDVAGVNAASVKVIGGVGEINVIGSARTIAVYTAAGALVSRGNASVSCASGLYIVRVDGSVFKVLVK
jgi:hypothetical protein